jgi:glycosyltransferase involved in cell wall biosynthesis
MMRILLIHNTSFRTFGDRIRVEKIQQTLSNSGFEVSELRLPIGQRFDLLVPKNLANLFIGFFFSSKTFRTKQNISIFTIPGLIIDSASFGFLQKQISRIKPDIIIAETSKVGLIASIVAKKHGVPCITDMHGLSFAEAIGSRRKNWQKTMYTDIEALHNSDCVIVVSKKMRDYIVEKWKIPKVKIIVAPNGSDLQEFHASYALPLRIIYAGGFSYWEKIQDFIKIAKYANPEKFKFYLAGDGPLREEILETIKKENIAITYFGSIPKRKIFSILSKMQIGIAPSTHDLTRQVASPVKIYDYLAAGLPVITPKIGDWGNMIADKNCGIALEVDSLQEYLNALNTLMNKESWNEKSFNAIKVIADEHSWTKSLESLVNFLQNSFLKKS